MFRLRPLVGDLDVTNSIIKNVELALTKIGDCAARLASNRRLPLGTIHNMATSSINSVRLPISQLKIRTPLSDKFQHILSLFPDNLAFAFAYGSGAF